MDLDPLLKAIGAVLATLGERSANLFLSPGEISSITSLAAALLVAAAFLAAQRFRRGRRLRPRALLRMLFRQVRLRPSQKADIFYFLFNGFAAGAIIGGAVLSFSAVSAGVAALSRLAFGPPPEPLLPEGAARAVLTFCLFLAYELGHWVDHWLSHKVPALWDFHKVHHSAEELTPLTVWRVHPLESLKFANVVALFTGATSGVGQYLLGGGIEAFVVSGTNAIMVGFIYAYLHLQHTHLWIPFRGLAGRLLHSPAHHQIHHSSHPSHHNKNFGGCLALWDWVFGTLQVPGRRPEKLHFGVQPGRAHDHSLTEVFLRPFARAAARVPRWLRRRGLLQPADGRAEPLTRAAQR